MLIRKAELQDAETVYVLMCELEEQVLPQSEFIRSFSNLLKLPEHFLLIGEIDGRAAAFLHLRVEEQLHHAAKIAEILEFDVAQASRGRHLGQQFFAYAKKLACENGCQQLELSSNKLREKAHSFYERQGMHKFHYKFTLPLTGSAVSENKLGI